MDHHRAVTLVVGAHVFQLEAFREVVVHLDGTQLPAAADGVFHHEVELRAVESGFAVFHHGGQAFLGGRLDDGGFGLLPVLVGADVLAAVNLVAQRHLGRELVELQRAENVKHDVDDLAELFLELVGTAEEVGVVLRKAADAGQAVQLTALLVTVHSAEFREAERQVAVRTGLRLVDLAVVRAVHRFEQVLLPFLRGGDGTERVLAVFGPVAGGDVEFLVADVRGDHLQVAVVLLDLAQELLQPLAQRGALGQPERKTHTHFRREGEEFHLLAEFAVVALLGFLEHGQVFVEHALLGEGDAVDAGELLVVLVTAPVGTGDVEQLDRLDDRGIAQVRTATQVGEGTVLVERDGAVLKVADQFALVLVAFFRIFLERVRFRDVRADEVLAAAGQLKHLVFDFLQVGFHELPVAQIHIVIETVLDRRADTELDAGIQRFERFGHQVARGVPESGFRLAVFPFVEFQCRIFEDGAFEIVNLVADRCTQHIVGEPGADGGRDLVGRHALLELFDVAVRKGNFDHNHYN